MTTKNGIVANPVHYHVNVNGALATPLETRDSSRQYTQAVGLHNVQAYNMAYLDVATVYTCI